MVMEIGSRSVAQYKEEAAALTSQSQALMSWKWGRLHLECQEFPLNLPQQSFKIITSLKWDKTLRSRENKKIALITARTENQILIFLSPQTWALSTVLYGFPKQLLKDAAGLLPLFNKLLILTSLSLGTSPLGKNVMTNKNSLVLIRAICSIFRS